MWDINEIIKTIPHRYPFLLVDRILSYEPEKKITALKNVTYNESFFQGHFPGQPIMPGVLIIEALAQTAAAIALRRPEYKDKLVYFAGIDSIRFRKPVVPGDQLILEATLLWVRGSLGRLKVVAKVKDEIATDGEILFSIVDRGGKGSSIPPSAVVHPTASLGKVKVGPNVVIGPEVEIGDGTNIAANTMIGQRTKIGKDNKIGEGVVIGVPPQDIKYKGEKSEVIIGDRNIIREYVTIHLASGENGKTKIGNDNFIMVHAHVPHNCEIGNHVVIGGYVGLAGYTKIHDHVVIGGLAGIHQYARIGDYAMVGAQSKVVQDVPPFMLVEGNPAQVRCVNSIGLQRKGIPQEAQAEIKKAFKLIYESKFNLSRAIEEIKKRLRPLDEINLLLRFLQQESRRGISKKVAIEDFQEELVFPEIPELGI
jgi:UDP-N-acetylglucosamine acyltransferase